MCFPKILIIPVNGRVNAEQYGQINHTFITSVSVALSNTLKVLNIYLSTFKTIPLKCKSVFHNSVVMK